ncbi:MAG: ribosomal L7Ae/L30e/S12e/Gadd45 family protein [Ruminiclostridium sp.]|nr:ribosomal L7Ae/L30e/S12e/Gadd45 family protein [Ruminiclostridium sp.]
MDNIPNLLGLVHRAGKLAIGEEPVAALCRDHKAYLLLLAQDAAENSVRRAHLYAQSSENNLCVTIPLTKDELGSGLGRNSCAMVAIGDMGFAAAVADRLAKADPEHYAALSQLLAEKAARAKKRRDEKREKTTRPGKPKPRSANNSKKKKP